MTTVLSTTAAAAASSASSSKPKNSLSSLGANDFLKLMTAQLKQQDPTNPTDNSAMLAQMAQFTSLSQATDMNKGIAELNAKMGEIATKLDAVLTAQQAAQTNSTPSANA